MNANEKVLGLNQAENILHEQLALKRLKELKARVPIPEIPAWRRWKLGGVGIAILGLLRQPELVRENGPGLAPSLRHEWERERFLHVR